LEDESRGLTHHRRCRDLQPRCSAARGPPARPVPPGLDAAHPIPALLTHRGRRRADCSAGSKPLFSVDPGSLEARSADPPHTPNATAPRFPWKTLTTFRISPVALHALMRGHHVSGFDRAAQPTPKLKTPKIISGFQGGGVPSHIRVK
jgi:hypothetical protein